MHAAPSGLVKREADRIDDRILRANIEISTVFDIVKRAPQEHVLEVLRVRNKSHDARLSTGPLSRSSSGCSPISTNSRSTLSLHVGRSGEGARRRVLTSSKLI